MSEITVSADKSIRLVPARPSMAAAIFEVLDSDREHVSRFLPWVSKNTQAKHTEAYIVQKISSTPLGYDFIYAIYVGNEVAGMIEFHHYDEVNHRAEIGYWLTTKFTHQGIMTASVKALCQYGFEQMGLHQIGLFAEVENLPSNAVIERAGFTFLATHPEYMYRDGAYHDANEYYLIN